MLPCRHGLARWTKIFRQNNLKIFILGQNFSENFCPRIELFLKFFVLAMWGRTNFIWVGQKIGRKLKNFVLRQKFSENFVLGQKFSGRKFSENFCPRTKFFVLGQFFSRTKIPMTGVSS